jgi:glyoxylase-like metal-dependent hydrolase (beta-lactamase superfamily II)
MKRVSVGNVEVIALLDLVERYEVGMVYPKGERLRERYAGYLDGEGRVELAFAAFLVRDEEHLVLVDTGWGPEHEGRLLLEMEAAGVRPEEVDTVVFTHLHGDHTGWNIDRTTGRPTFPRARYLVPKLDWDHYAGANNAAFERDVRPLEAAGRIELVEGERTLSIGVTTVPTPGHTPGHTSIAIVSGGERAMILGDVVLSAVDAEEPGLESVFDSDRVVAVETRKGMLRRLVEEGALVGASHLPPEGLGRFVARGRGQRWQAL